MREHISGHTPPRRLWDQASQIDLTSFETGYAVRTEPSLGPKPQIPTYGSQRPRDPPEMDRSQLLPSPLSRFLRGRMIGSQQPHCFSGPTSRDVLPTQMLGRTAILLTFRQNVEDWRLL